MPLFLHLPMADCHFGYKQKSTIQTLSNSFSRRTQKQMMANFWFPKHQPLLYKWDNISLDDLFSMAHNVVIVTHLTECFKAARIQHKFYTACPQCNTSAVSSRLPSNKSDSKQSFLLMTMHEISNPIAPTQNGFLIASVKGYIIEMPSSHLYLVWHKSLCPFEEHSLVSYFERGRVLSVLLLPLLQDGSLLS